MIDQLGKLFSFFYLLLKKPSLFQNPPPKKGKRKRKEKHPTDPEIKRKNLRNKHESQKMLKKKAQIPKNHLPLPQQPIFVFQQRFGI